MDEVSDNAPIEGEYIPFSSIFNGQMFLNEGHLQRFLKTTGKIPVNVQSGVHQVLGINALYVTFQ